MTESGEMLKVGFLGVVHMHSYGYASALQKQERAQLVSIWEPDAEAAAAFAERFGVPVRPEKDQLLAEVDAVVICSDNVSHAPLGIAAARAGRHILCEKPLVTRIEDGEALIAAAREAGVQLMTAFPCRYSPAFLQAKARVQAGELGQILAINATNRGRCPFGWFVEPSRSGGGAMIDHVVHVTDLLRVMLGSEVARVQAQTGNQMYGQDWDDTAKLTLEFENGVFATLDSSWSRHASYKTWGDVTLRIVGEEGVMDVDLFGQEIDAFREGTPSHAVYGYGSDLDGGLVADFVNAVLDGKPVPITGEDGLAASRVAIKGYTSSAARSVEPVSGP